MFMFDVFRQERDLSVIGGKMKIIEVIRKIPYERTKYKNQGTLTDKPTKIVHVHTVLPEEDLIALRKKTCEPTNKEAVSKAIYYYLKCQETDEESS